MVKVQDYVESLLVDGLALPEIVKADTDSLRLASRIRNQLPGIQNVSSDSLVGYSTKALDAEMRAIEMGLAFGDTKRQLKLQSIISKQEEKAIENFLKRRDRNFKKRLGALHRSNVENSNRFIRRFAGELLGLGPNLYRVLS